MWHQKYCVVFHFFSLFSSTYWKEENRFKRLEQEILDSMSFPPSSAIHHHPARYLSPHTSNCTFKNNSGVFPSQGDILALVFLYGVMKFYLPLSFSLKNLEVFHRSFGWSFPPRHNTFIKFITYKTAKLPAFFTLIWDTKYEHMWRWDLSVSTFKMLINTTVLQGAVKYLKRIIWVFPKPKQRQKLTRWVLFHEQNMSSRLYDSTSIAREDTYQNQIEVSSQSISRLFTVPVDWQNKYFCFSVILPVERRSRSNPTLF